MIPKQMFHARLYDQAGIVARIDRALTFFDPRTGDSLVIEPDMLNFIVTTGPVLPVEMPALYLQMQGNHLHLACRMGE